VGGDLYLDNNSFSEDERTRIKNHCNELELII
jgi:hypothetical protein